MWQSAFLMGFIIIELWIISGGFFGSKDMLLKYAKELSEYDRLFWLNKQEKVKFKNQYEEYSQDFEQEEIDYEKEMEEYKMVQDRISYLHYTAQENEISINQDGNYSQRSHLGKKIQRELDTLDEISSPYKPSFSFQSSLSNLPKSRWKSFDDLWTKYNEAKNVAKSFLWAFYGWLISATLVEWFTDGSIGFVTFLVAGIGAIISFIIVASLYKKEKHNIPVPEGVTIKNIDTHIEPKYSISLCRNSKCLWENINGFNNQRIVANELYLSNNQFTELPKEILRIPDLMRLDLDYNQLTDLPKEIGQLSNLTGLYFSNNHFAELPKEIGQLSNLNYLYLYNNKLIELPKEIGQLSNLNYLNLHDNQLTDLPKEIGQLGNLAGLYLYNNQLIELPKEIGQLSNLTELYLSNNQFTELPKEIGQLSNLTELSLYSNQLIELPKEIGQLSNLNDLNLDDNQLIELPKEIGQLSNLNYLSLSNNQFTELPKEIGQLSNLTELHLSYNQLTKLPDEIIQLTSLTKFSLLKNTNMHLTLAQIEWLEKLKENNCKLWGII